MKVSKKSPKSSEQVSKVTKKKFIDERINDIMLEISRLFKDKKVRAYYLGPGPLALKAPGKIDAKNIVPTYLFKIKFRKEVIEVIIKDVSETEKKVQQALKKKGIKV